MIALKHHTSKLSSFDDLSSLHTFGFRGEALSSLCALAEFHIVTAQANQVPRANRLEFESSGKLRKTQIVAGQKGTSASVEGIFKRLPVRRRELEKNIKREYGKVLNLLHAYACISTGVRFSVRNTVGKTKNVVVFSTNGNRTTKENITNVYGAKTLAALTSLDLEFEFQPSIATKRAGSGEQLNQIALRGHISRPVLGEGRQTPDRQMFFVNSRPCGLPQIAKAFNEVYKTFNVSQSPFIFADFQMDTNAYDVNVSPDKRSILLHDAGALIESLKTSLTKLFEAADQTVPQSQVLGTKTPVAKQQALGSLPGFVSARQLGEDTFRDETTPKATKRGGNAEEQLESTQGKMPNTQEPVSVEADSSQVEIPSSPSKRPQGPLQFPRSSPVAPSPEPGLVPTRARSTSRPCPEQTESEGPNELTSRVSPEPSSQLLDVEEPSTQQSDEPESTPNVVQSAFDRMRPRRMPAEMATITIDDRTVTSMVGSGLPRKRSSNFTYSDREPPQRKRRIHTPSRPNIFGESMKAFAAPGTQTREEKNDENDSALEETEDEYHEEEAEEAEAEEELESEQEEPVETDSSPVPDDADYVQKDQDSRQIESESTQRTIEGDTEATANEASLDDAEKKAEDEAVVRRLIHRAEEQALLPGEHNKSRANKMDKGAAHRDGTVHLISTIDTSLSRLRAQMAKLRQSLQPGGDFQQKVNLGDEKTAEDRLSLTVSKADFNQMRIIGQFNLGFIIAVRPDKDHDELFIIDQHASDEKYNFERLQAETVVQNQRLVRPQRLDLTAVEEEIVLENRSALEKNGFLVTVDESGDEPIGRRCQLVSLPLSKEVVFDSRDLEELIVLLSESPVTNGISVPRPGKVRKMFAMRACRSSIMIGKTLTTRQMQRVVQNMGTIDKPWNCPHGRPTMRHLMSLGQSADWDEYKDPDESDALDVWRRYVDQSGDDEES